MFEDDSFIMLKLTFWKIQRTGTRTKFASRKTCKIAYNYLQRAVMKIM